MVMFIAVLLGGIRISRVRISEEAKVNMKFPSKVD